MGRCRSGGCRRGACERGGGARSWARWRRKRWASRAYIFPFLPHTPALLVPRLGGAGGANCGGAHSSSSFVSSPSCEGTVPFRSLPPRILKRGGGGAGSCGGGGDASGGRGVARASLSCLTLYYPCPMRRIGGGGSELWWRSQARQIGEQPELRWDGAGQVVAPQGPAERGVGRGHVDEIAGANCGGAHRYFRLVSSPSCEGTVPVRLLLARSLRERGWGGAGSRGR